MRARITSHVAIISVASGLAVGCQHSRPQTGNAPVTPRIYEDHCTWALRSALPPDSVAARYARSFTTLGLADPGWSHLADTAWAAGGAALLTRPAGTGTYTAHLVAYRAGEGTLLRLFVGVKPEGSVNVGRLLIPFCGAAMHAAGVATTASGSTGDALANDSLPVWRRRPVR